MYQKFILIILFSSFIQCYGQNYVKIGKLYWADHNLNTSTFANGDEIIEAKSPEDWQEFFKQGIPAFCSMNYNSKNDSIHGKIYNWFAVVDPRGLAPEGFMVPALEDWLGLRAYLNYDTICRCYPPILRSAEKLKSNKEWLEGSKGENLFNMNILPSGYLLNDGNLQGRFVQTSFWTSTPKNAAGVVGDSYTTYYIIFNGVKKDLLYDNNFDANGHFVRCATGKQFYSFPPTNTSPDSDSDSNPSGEEGDDK
jgi:uncharacterized protein (TIGR02145 family)